jgi:hypothetical protein
MHFARLTNEPHRSPSGFWSRTCIALLARVASTRIHRKTNCSHQFFPISCKQSRRAFVLSQKLLKTARGAVVKTRSTSGRKSHLKLANHRAPRGHIAHRNASKLTVTPVAMQVSSSGEAVIPVTVKGDGRSAQAVIPVEVPTAGKSRKRAAVVPITVQRRSAHARRHRRKLSAVRRKRRVDTRSAETRIFEIVPREYPKPWRTFLMDAICEAMGVEESTLRLGVEYGHTAVGLLQSILFPFLGRPADQQVSEFGTPSPRRVRPKVAGADCISRLSVAGRSVQTQVDKVRSSSAAA